MAIPGKSRSLMGLLSSMVSESHGIGKGIRSPSHSTRLPFVLNRGAKVRGKHFNKNAIGFVALKIVHRI